MVWLKHIGTVILFVLINGGILHAQQSDASQLSDTTQPDSIKTDTLLPLKPYYMHNFGVCVRSRYAYIAEYNFRFTPHLGFKLAGGTADHTHYNLMGFDQTKTTGRYIGGGISFHSTNYFTPKKSYKHQHGLIVSLVGGRGNLHFTGTARFDGNYYPDAEINTTEEDLRYRFYEVRLGYELIADRVVRFDFYPIQFTFADITNPSTLNHQYIPAIGVIRNGNLNPGFGLHLIINQNKKKKKK